MPLCVDGPFGWPRSGLRRSARQPFKRNAQRRSAVDKSDWPRPRPRLPLPPPRPVVTTPLQETAGPARARQDPVVRGPSRPSALAGAPSVGMHRPRRPPIPRPRWAQPPPPPPPRNNRPVGEGLAGPAPPPRVPPVVLPRPGVGPGTPRGGRPWPSPATGPRDPCCPACPVPGRWGTEGRCPQGARDPHPARGLGSRQGAVAKGPPRLRGGRG